MKYTELIPELYDQKSYYSKARIVKGGNFITLYSYGVKMVELYKNEIISLNDKPENYTTTTLKHVKDFLYQTLGLINLTKSDLLEMQKDIGKKYKKQENKIIIRNF